MGYGRYDWLQALENFLLRAITLTPWLQQQPGKSLMHTARSVDGEDMRFLWHLFELLHHEGRCCLKIVEVGVLRRLDHVEQDSLIFFRREFLLRGRIHEDGCSNDANKHENCDRPEVKRTVETLLITVLERIKIAIEELGELSPRRVMLEK